MPARWIGRQFHNQPEASHMHGFLVALWEEVRAATGGALDVTVHAWNGGVGGSDPAVLDMLVSGELEFMTLKSFGKSFILPLDCLIGWFGMPGKKLRLFNRVSGTIVIKTDYREPEGVRYVMDHE